MAADSSPVRSLMPAVCADSVVKVSMSSAVIGAPLALSSGASTAAAMMILMIAGIHYRLPDTTSRTGSAATADALLDQGVVFDMSTV